jgi:hypothetical protein
MITSLPSRTLTVVALILSMATATVLLALAPRAVAQGRGTVCRPPSTAHPTRGARACTQSKATSKSSRKSKAHPRSKGKGPRYKHAAANTKRGAAANRTAKTKAKSPAGTSQSPAICENRSVPVRASDGYFSCADESEPICENGSIPTLSNNGSTLLCGAEPSGGPAPAEATCEDGSLPLLAGDGSFSCHDESAPGCENGSAPTLSSDRSTLLCNVIVGAKGAG